MRVVHGIVFVTLGFALFACQGTDYPIAPNAGDEPIVEAPDLADPPVNGDAMPDFRTFREFVWANCYMVRDAAEAYAEQNNGTYPFEVDEPGADGRSLIDFLPGGVLLVNTATRERTEPARRQVTAPGEIAYLPIVAGGVVVGYTVQGFGRHWIVLTLAYAYGEPFPCEGRRCP